MRKLAFSDAHCHSNPTSGLGAKVIAEKFIKVGGWFIALVMLPSWGYGPQALTVEDYIKRVNLHLKECEAARKAGLKVACYAGYHPAEIDRAAERGLSYLKIAELGKKIIDKLVDLCVEGRLQGVGEIGRQHYKARPESVIVANELLAYAMVRSRECYCPLQLHLENTRGFTAFQVKDMIEKAGLPKNRVIVHHAKSGPLEEVVEQGLWATTPGIYEALKAALKGVGTNNLLIESDFIDDPKRPGAVVEPWGSVENQLRLYREGLVDDRVLEELNINNVERAFKVEP